MLAQLPQPQHQEQHKERRQRISWCCSVADDAFVGECRNAKGRRIENECPRNVGGALVTHDDMAQDSLRNPKAHEGGTVQADRNGVIEPVGCGHLRD